MIKCRSKGISLYSGTGFLVGIGGSLKPYFFKKFWSLWVGERGTFTMFRPPPFGPLAPPPPSSRDPPLWYTCLEPVVALVPLKGLSPGPLATLKPLGRSLPRVTPPADLSHKVGRGVLLESGPWDSGPGRLTPHPRNLVGGGGVPRSSRGCVPCQRLTRRRGEPCRSHWSW